MFGNTPRFQNTKILEIMDGNKLVNFIESRNREKCPRTNIISFRFFVCVKNGKEISQCYTRSLQLFTKR